MESKLPAISINDLLKVFGASLSIMLASYYGYDRSQENNPYGANTIFGTVDSRPYQERARNDSDPNPVEILLDDLEVEQRNLLHGEGK